MTCDRCGKPIAVTSEDPVIATSLGRMHVLCSREAWADKARAEAAHDAEVTERRREAGRRAFAKRKEPSPC